MEDREPLLRQKFMKDFQKAIDKTVWFGKIKEELKY